MLRTDRTRRLAAVITALVVTALVAACGSAPTAGGTAPKSPPGDLTGRTFAFALPTSEAAVYVNQADMFKKQAEQLGAKVEIYDNGGSAEAMLRNASLMVAAKPDVIVEFAPVADATARVGRMFTDAKIPCIAVNVPVEGCPLFNFDQPYLAGLGAADMAAAMQKRGWDASNTTVVIGQASQLGASVNIAVTSFYDRLSATVPGMQHVAATDIGPKTTVITPDQGVQADLGLTIDSGYTAMQNVLQTIPANRNLIVYTVSDDTTVGVRRAIASAGRTATTLVSGYGGSDVALDALRADDGWVTEQMGFFAYWGEFVLAMAAAVATGVTPPPLTAPPMVVLRKDNLDTYFHPGTADLISMPPLPEESRYLVDTGILQKFGNLDLTH